MGARITLVGKDDIVFSATSAAQLTRAHAADEDAEVTHMNTRLSSYTKGDGGSLDS